MDFHESQLGGGQVIDKEAYAKKNEHEQSVVS